MSYDEMELDMVGDQRTALFIIISDTDDTFNFVVAMMYSQLFNLLCDRADDVHHGRLPYHVRILADEFANIGQIPKFDKLIATIRSREISASIILQSQSQLKTIYKDAAETILGNCDTMLFLGGKESSTLKEISETLGKETIDLYNTSDTRGQSRSYGMNYQKTGKELMSRDELAVMDGSKCILQLRGVRPFFSDKFDITKHKRYKELSDYDKKNEFDVEAYMRHRMEVKLTRTQEFDLYVADETLLMGYNEKDMDSLTTAIVSGNITENTELIVSDPDRVYDVYHWKPQIGNTVTFNFKNNSGKTITKTFKIGAITSSNDGMGGYIFRMPEKMMHELVGYDCTYAIEVQTEPESIQEAENKIRSLIAGNDEVSLQTLQDFTKEHQEDNQAGFTLAYIISAILWVFAVINQINLTVTNLLSQKQEMGTLKSIGMTNKQLEQSFMIEGLFNTGISLFMTIIIGIPGGYMIGTFLEKAGMSTGFVFPTRAFLLFVTVMLLLEVLMTILLIHSWKKQSVIEIMRN